MDNRGAEIERYAAESVQVDTVRLRQEMERVIDETTTPEDVADWRLRFGGMEEVLRLRGLTEAAKIASEGKIRCVVKIGRWLNENRPHGTNRFSDRPEPSSTLPKPDLGVSAREETKWRRVSELADDAIDAYLEAADEPTVSALFDLRKAEQRVQERQQRDEELTKRPLPDVATLTAFPVLYVDPPWRYDFEESSSREIENQYPTMTLAELKAMQVPAEADSVLFMWATSPKLTEALELMEAWGFEYRTNMVWVKDRIGMGYYARQQHELLLIGKRGNLPVPDPQDRPSSVITAPRGPHSAKPHTVYDTLDRMYPKMAKVELFARQAARHPLWTAWGNQA